MPAHSWIYDQILRDYVADELPDTVTERQLTARYAVTPVELRTSLLLLAEYGILHRNQGKGWHFEPGLTTANSLEQSHRFRMIVVCGELREPGFRLDAGGMDRVSRAHAQFFDRLGENSAFEVFSINSDFHSLLADNSGNPFVKKAVENQNRLRRLHELSDFQNLMLDHMRQSCSEHLEIPTALEVGDNERAANLMKTAC